MSEPQFEPDWFSNPGNTVATLMHRRSVTPSKLAEEMGWEIGEVRSLLTGTLAIQESQAADLAKHLGATTAFWQKRYDAFQCALERTAKKIPELDQAAWAENFPARSMLELNWLAKPLRKTERLKAFMAFFNVSSPEEWSQRYASFSGSVAFRTSARLESKVGGVTAWLRQGEIDASFVACQPWDRAGLRRRIPELRTLTKAKSPNYFFPKIRAICAEVGVAVVFARTPEGCRASGATRFVSRDKAMILMSFRHLSDDHFWFTFFHEVGHLLLHKSETTFVDIDNASPNHKELEANEFASGVLIPHERREELLDLKPQTQSVLRFAASVGTSPGIVVGQLQHAGAIAPHQLTFLKRRYNWGELEHLLTL